MTQNKRPDVCMVVHNPLVYDARVLREAASLARNGWLVVILSLTPDEYNLPSVELLKGFTIYRISLPSGYRRLAKSLHNCLVSLQKRESDFQNNKASNQNIWSILKCAIEKLMVKFLSYIYTLLLSDESPVAMLLVLLRGAYFLRYIDAHIYHAHDFPGLLHVAIAGIWKRPVVYDSHELFFDQWYPYESPQIYRNLRSWEKFLAKRASAILTVGEMVADRLSETLNIKRPTIIFNTVDLRTLEPSKVTYQTRKRRTVVHSGALNYGRHLPELLTSLLYLPEDIVIVLMGDGVLKGSLQLQAKEIGMEDRVIFVPPVLPDSIAPTLSQADVGAVLITNHSIHYDYSMPNKLFECIAAGLPLIVSHCQEIANLTRKYDLGIVCDPMQPKEIAAGILEILEPINHERYKQNICNARDSFLNWESEEEKLLDIYRAFKQ
jgi:glycosyltransferase involved in cell wall biosynthesis